MGLIRGFIAPTSDCKPSEKGLHENCEEEWGQSVPLEGASIDAEWGGVSVDGHVVCVGSRVELFACRDIGVLKSVFSHELEQDPVVHASEGAFKV